MLKILFCGGKRVGYHCLEFLIEQKFNIVGVVPNSSDISVNRNFPSVTELAWKNNLLVLSDRKLHSIEKINQIKNLQPDIIVVVYFDKILKESLIEIPSLGCINLHMALAEEYRGCFPTTWAILNNETKAGVTLHYIDKEIDSGDIIAQVEVSLTEETTGKSLYDECTIAGISLFKKTFPLILNGNAPRRPQATNEKTKYYKREFPSQEIDFSKTGKEILQHIRAHTFPPFPAPYFFIGNKKFVVIESKEE